jgi:hypothetical protein
MAASVRAPAARSVDHGCCARDSRLGADSVCAYDGDAERGAGVCGGNRLLTVNRPRIIFRREDRNVSRRSHKWFPRMEPKWFPRMELGTAAFRICRRVCRCKRSVPRCEHGLVLRRAGLPDGEEAFVREVGEIVYAQAVPLETFAFESCPRERRRTGAPSRRRPPSMLRLRSRRCLCSGSTRSRRRYPAGEAGGMS